MKLRGVRTSLPRGRLLQARVVENPREALAAALDRELTGYAVFDPQDALLLGADASGVLTFTSGVPVLAYHTSTERGGPPALADLAVPGPYRVQFYELDPTTLVDVHDTPELRVPPGLPADRLAGDPKLAARTRAAAPDDRTEEVSTGATDAEPSVVESFLADEEKIAAIREQAREEARERAAEWGLDGELSERE